MNSPKADLATWAHISPRRLRDGAAMFNVAGGGGRDGRWSIIDVAGHKLVAQEQEKDTVAGSGPSETTGWIKLGEQNKRKKQTVD